MSAINSPPEQSPELAEAKVWLGRRSDAGKVLGNTLGPTSPESSWDTLVGNCWFT